MKRYFLFLLFISPFLLNAQIAEDDFPIGIVKKSIFFNEKYNEIYKPEYDRYTPNTEAIKYLQANKGRLKLKMVMGFWCDDSKIYVPHLLKILDNANWDKDNDGQLKIISVNRNKEADIENFKELAIDKIPTIIVLYNDIEIGRIIESPKISIEQDLVNIIKLIEK